MPQDSAPNKIFQAKLIEIKNLVTDIHEVSIKTDSPFTFSAGQYIWVEIPNMIFPDSRGARRAFSITSAPDDNTIRIILKGSETGYKKSFLRLKSNDPLTVHGPFGSFLKEGLEGKSDLIFVGGGIAIAPYISVIRYLFGQNTTRNIYLINVKKDPGENLYTEELKAIAEKNGNFTFIQTFGRPDQTLIAQANAKLPQALWYVTGPQGFVDSVYTFLAAAAVNPERVNYEEHYPTIGRFSSIQISDLNLESSSLFKLAIDKTSLHVVITDINGYVLYANEAAEKLTGYTAAEILGNTPRLWGGLMSRDFYKQLWATKKTNQKPFIEKITNRRKNGEIYIAQATISPIINSEGKTLGFIGTEEDITNTEQARIDLEKFNKISVNRELKMVELKNKIAALEKKVTE